MKKLLMITLVALCATITNAASVQWGSKGYTLVDKDGVVQTSIADGGQIVLALLGTQADFSDATVLQVGAIGSSSKTKGRVSGTYAFEYGATSIQSGDILAVLYYKDDKFSKLLDATGNNPMYTEYTVTGLGDDSWSGTIYEFATGNFQTPATAPIPEPTSGLLLLMGGALLALRRKQK